MIQCFIKCVLYALSTKSSSLLICNSCVSVSTVLQWTRRHIPLGYLKQPKYCLTFLGVRAERDCSFRQRRFLRGMWILPKKITEVYHCSVLFLFFFVLLWWSRKCPPWIDFQMWMNILTFVINISCYLIIYHTTPDWLNAYCFELCSFQNKTSTLSFLSSLRPFSLICLKKGLKQKAEYTKRNLILSEM